MGCFPRYTVRRSLRAQLLTVAVLGVLTCALALYALGRPLTMANTQRFERARDGVVAEVQRLRVTHDATPAYPVSLLFGMRSGLLPADQSSELLDPPLDAEARDMLAQAIVDARSSADLREVDCSVSRGTLFVAAAPATDRRTAWAVYLMNPPKWTPVLRVVGLALAVTSFALVLAALFSVSSVQRDAGALVRSLEALGKKLDAPVERPAIREFHEVGTGIERLARELGAAEAALAERERLAVLGRVSAGVAHELRNPLAAIKLRVDMVRKNPEAPPELAAELGIAVEEVDRLDRLVNDLLTVAGRRTGPRSEIELGAFSRRRASLMEDLARDHGVRIAVSGEANVTVDGDSAARLIDNLLRNAIEASPREGIVKVAAATVDGGARLRVLDEGEGVPEARKAELFEPFFTTKERGVGLGLALSRAVAAAHGGTLTYARDGRMTVFEVFLPHQVTAA